MLPLYITSGEPAGIGPDICLSLADRIDERPLVVLADLYMLRQRAQQLKLLVELIEYTGQTTSSEKGQLYVEHVPLKEPVVLGQLNSHNAAYVLEQLRRSAKYAMSGKVSEWLQRQCRSQSLMMQASISVVIPSITRNLLVYRVW